MKVVLRHKITGRYYQAPGQWVRRADNARTFADPGAARQFSRHNRLLSAQPVFRLAPYLMPLLQQKCPTIWDGWMRGCAVNRHSVRPGKFSRN
jgi:hypothetical protein